MSGIVGLYYLDHRPVNPAGLAKMVDILAHRGPDGADAWCQGSVGLGHRMLWTTPESLHEKMPLVRQSGDLVITADARIDNRAQLIDLLRLGDRPPGEIGDGELILAAYEKWGDACPEHLLGDFAFAIWDGHKQRLFCARDHFGVKPFFYYASAQLFVFASEIKALFCLADVPRRLNELRVGYHLALTLEDKAITFYQDIKRLLPGHSLTVNRDTVRMHTYWSLDPTHDVRLDSDEAYAEAFRELFVEAVRCRLRSAFPVGSLLSGGLDSSAVTCMAQALMTRNGGGRLRTISAIYEQIPECDERSFIRAVLAQGELEPHYVYADQLGPLADWEQVFRSGDEPYASPTIYILWGLCRTARAQGIRVLLDGIDGDTAVSHGYGYLAELARTGQWGVFALEAEAVARHENLPPVSLLIQQFGYPYLSELARGWRWLTFAREVNALSKQFKLPRRKLVRNYGLEPALPGSMLRTWRALRKRNRPARNGTQIIKREFAERIALDDRVKALAKRQSTPPKSAKEEHYGLLTSGLIPSAFELANTAGTAFAVDNRHPFSDRRLVEFCLGLPPEQKLRQGWVRFIMRRALAGILPDEIQWRGGKTSNSPAFTYGLLNLEAALLERVIMNDSEHLGPYVDIAALRETYRRYLAHKHPADEMKIWQVVTLALWLHYTELIPQG